MIRADLQVSLENPLLRPCGKAAKTFEAVYDLPYLAQAPTAEMAETPPSIKKSAPTTYAESSDAR